jgi:hypothetical protein
MPLSTEQHKQRAEVQGNPLRFHGRQRSEGGTTFRIQVGAQVTGFAVETKAETFWE